MFNIDLGCVEASGGIPQIDRKMANIKHIDRAFIEKVHDKKHNNIILKRAIKNINGEKYITPGDMTMILDCHVDELCEEIAMHKNIVGEFFLEDTEKIKYNMKIALEGWVNFLSFPRFVVSKEIERCINILKVA